MEAMVNYRRVCVVRVVVCAAIAAIARCGLSAEVPKEIRVLTYNISNGRGMDGELNLDRIAKVIVAAKPDLVALQAVDRKTERSGGVDQAADLGKLTGMKAVFSPTIEIDGGAYGNAVLTKLPVRSQETVKLKMIKTSEQRPPEQRCLQVVEIGEKGGSGLLFLCTNLAYGIANEERMEAAKTINEFVRKRHDTPAILAGTLNFYPGFDVPHEFVKEWRIVGVDREGTNLQPEKGPGRKKYYLSPSNPADEPRWYSNYVLYRPAAKWEVAELQVVNEQAASTHRPVLVVLRRVEKDSAGKDTK
jgi:endonuclease/exonuclease/phosphatase family metal-dependent hydrolase